MALYIVEAECISCGDCEPICPTESIKSGKIVFEIDARTCTECEGDHDEPQCVSVCPVDNCILPLAS
jgi:ferredoxin